MTKSIEDIVRDGYRIWQKNTILGIPFLFSAILELCVLIATLVFIIPILAFITITDLVYVIDDLILKIFTIFPILFLLLCIVVTVLNIVKSFFIAGAVGMTRTAIETGRTSLNDMIKYGKNKFLYIFIMHMIIFVLSITGILLFVPSVMAFKINMFNLGIAMMIIAFFLFALYLTGLAIIMIMFPFSIVFKNLSPINAIKDNYSIIMENKLSVLFLFFVSHGLIWAINLLLDPILSFFGIIPLLGSVINLGIVILYILFLVGIVTPLITVWWACLYLDRAGIKPREVPEEIPPEVPVPILGEQIKEKIQGHIYL